MNQEQVVYEQGAEMAGYGAPVFITAVVIDHERRRVTRQSHVFIPGEEAQLHEIVFPPFGSGDFAAAVQEGVRRTHQLFADHVGSRPASVGGDRLGFPGFDRGFGYLSRCLSEHPFHVLRLQPKFLDHLWDIQAWTPSATLRQALAQVTGYKVDPQEQALLGRLFTPVQTGSTLGAWSSDQTA